MNLSPKSRKDIFLEKHFNLFPPCTVVQFFPEAYSKLKMEKNPPRGQWEHHPLQKVPLSLSLPTLQSSFLHFFWYICILTHVYFYINTQTCTYTWGFPTGTDSKESACNAGDLGSILGSGRSPGERNGNPLLYSWLGNHMDRGAWQVPVHRVAKSRTRLSD